MLNGVVPGDVTFWSNLGMTWTIPVFAFFYLVAPWILKRIKGVFSAVAVWGFVLVFSEIIKLFYSCTVVSDLHYFFLGAVIYWCVYKNVYKQASVLFLVGALGAVTAGIDFIAYTFIFSAIILVFVNCDTIIFPEKIQKFINKLDGYSYTVYLVQGIIFVSVIDKLKEHIGLPVWAVAVISVIGTIVLTLIIGKFVEKPLQRSLTRRFLNT